MEEFLFIMNCHLQSVLLNENNSKVNIILWILCWSLDMWSGLANSHEHDTICEILHGLFNVGFSLKFHLTQNLHIS